MRAAREVVRSEWTCCGSPSCLRLKSSVDGMELYGDFVRSCSDFDSWCKVEGVGCTKDAFQERIGKACWL